MAADLAGIALVVASPTALNRFWLATIAGLVVSAVCLFAPIVARSMADGPGGGKFYKEHVGRDTATAQYDLCRELTTSLAENKRTLGGWRSATPNRPSEVALPADGVVAVHRRLPAH